MYAQIEKHKVKESRAVANSVGQRKNRVNQGIGIVDNRPNSIIQRYDMTDFNKIKGLVESYSANPKLTSVIDDEGKFNKAISAFKGYIKLDETEKKMVFDQVKMKIKYNKLDVVEPEDENDIKKNFNSLKSCVITALMFAENGSVLGTGSVEGLHHILYKQFPKWKQYSDDDVHAQLYKEFGYNLSGISPKKRSQAVADSDRQRGMTASGGAIGHMVGFKKDGLNYKFKDNDNGEASSTAHATKNNMVDKLWWKG